MSVFFGKRTWVEEWSCINPTTDPNQVLAGFTAANVAGLLAFRPTGFTIRTVRAVMHLSPQFGATRYLGFVAQGNGQSNPAEVENCVLMEQVGAGGRRTRRTIRCWTDSEIEEDLQGNLINKAQIIQHLTGYKSAILQCLPGAGCMFRERRTKNPNNWYPIQQVVPLPNESSQLNLLAADFAALTATGYTGEVVLFGKRDRNLFGIRGVYFVQSADSPSLVIQYVIPNGQAPYNPIGLNIRRIVYNVDVVSALNLEDVRTRQTRDPIDRVRGRGVKVLTRFSRG